MTATLTRRQRPATGATPATSQVSPVAPSTGVAPSGATAWRDLALCAQVDPDLWFPEPGGDTQRPKAICRRCPVPRECLDYALAAGERHGVFGGLTARERRDLQKGVAA